MIFKKKRKTDHKADITKAQDVTAKTAPQDNYERIPVWCFVLLGLCALCAIIYGVMCISPQFADLINGTVGALSRFILAKLTSFLPFSVAEFSIILMPIPLVLVIRYFAKKRCKTPKQTAVSLVCIMSAASLFLSGFVLTFAAGYRGSTLDQKLSITRDKLSAKELDDATSYVVEQIEELSGKIEFGKDKFSVMPYDLKTMNEKLLKAYDSFSKDHRFVTSFNSRLKPVMLSEVMSYAHITGVYTFFTGESNLNVNFPDYTIPFTAAHELAHQRGIAREDEANMIAFLVSLESDDNYIRYCAYVNMFEYLISALTKADKKLAREQWKKLPSEVYSEQVAYRAFFKKYEKSVTSQVSGAVNDAYLKGQGTEGEKSYGMVVDLTVAYLKEQDLIPD